VPASTRSGQWVWIAPAALLLFVVLWEMSLGDFDVLTILFGTGEAGYGQGFITAPTMGCLCYSAVMALGRRWRGRSPAAGRRV
jgi:hypothetical protein